MDFKEPEWIMTQLEEHFPPVQRYKCLLYIRLEYPLEYCCCGRSYWHSRSLTLIILGAKIEFLVQDRIVSELDQPLLQIQRHKCLVCIWLEYPLEYGCCGSCEWDFRSLTLIILGAKNGLYSIGWDNIRSTEPIFTNQRKQMFDLIVVGLSTRAWLLAPV